VRLHYYLGASYVVVGLLAALVPLAQMLQFPATFFSGYGILKENL
jgi:hypothetical protein